MIGRPAGPPDRVVRDLLRAQAPHLADLPLGRRHGGYDNVTVRLGEDLAVRLPREAFGADLIGREHRGLEALGTLPLPVPRSVHLGVPGPGHPFPWRVVPWLPGQAAADALADPAVDPARLAADLGRFLHALHQPAPADAPRNRWRGMPLVERNVVTRRRLDALRADGVVAEDLLDAAEDLIDRAADRPAWDGGPRWVHGDLHARNVLIHRGRASAVIDFGDIHGGDPAVDLVAPWFLLDPAHHQLLREAAPHVDDDTWVRGRGWAVAIAAVVLDDVGDDPAFTTLARRALAGAVADRSGA